MKVSTCNDLKGACDAKITGETPDEMGQNSRKHVEEMIAAGDQAHKDAVEEMKNMSGDEFAAWHKSFTDGFDALPDA